MLLLAAGAGVLLTIVYLSPLREYHGRLREVSEDIRSFGALAPLVLMISVAALVAVGFSQVAVLHHSGDGSGLLVRPALGPVSAHFWAITLCSSWPGQAGAIGRNDFLPGVLDSSTSLQSRGALGVVLARQLPLPGLVINLACALVPIGHWDFLLGTFVGQLPQAIPSL
jgi:uncharacterized membrane protein YdjX (TVP38/TMEM64 family)